MSTAIHPAALELNADGIPWSASYDDIYYSDSGGLAQARHVFLAGNRVAERWRGRRQFVVLETGFGLGLNFLATWQAWRADPNASARLHFVSVEKHPFTRADLAQLHLYWPELAPLASELQAAWPPLTPGCHRLLLDAGRVTLSLFFGDAVKLIPQIECQADALYLDGFSPSKNPELWSESLLRRLSRCCAAEATLATWSYAAPVRRALQDAGWRLQRRPGFGSKRDMLGGERLPLRSHPRHAAAPEIQPRQVIVIGAGIAGCAAAEALARRGWQVQVLERRDGPAQEASGNPAGLFHPVITPDDNYIARISRAGNLYLTRLLPRLGADVRHGMCGVLQLARDAEQDAHQAAVIMALAFPADYVRYLDRQQASQAAGQPLAHGGWFYPAAGWVSPPTLCAALLAAWPQRITPRYATAVARLVRSADDDWLALDEAGETLARAPLVVVAGAYDSTRLVPDAALDMERIRGQVSIVPAGRLPPIATALCGNGYTTPDAGELRCFGATYDFRDDDPTLRATGHQTNLAHLAALLPTADLSGLDPMCMDGRVGFRTTTVDRLPAVGAAPDGNAPRRREAQLKEVPRHGGLHLLCGLGSRGMVWAPLAAELLAARIDGEPLPLERDLAAAMDPARFLLRQLRR